MTWSAGRRRRPDGVASTDGPHHCIARVDSAFQGRHVAYIGDGDLDRPQS
jgi:hypothetical protein